MVSPQPLNPCRYDYLQKSVRITLVGKYTSLEDAYASVIKALRHACLKAGRKLDLQVWGSVYMAV